MASGVLIGQALQGLMAQLAQVQADHQVLAGRRMPPMAVVLLGTVAATHLIHTHALTRAMRARGIPSGPKTPARCQTIDATDDPAAQILMREREVIAAYDRALARIEGADLALSSLLRRQRARIVRQVDDLAPVPLA